ncbi:unnamed protein product [Lathyrus sativus]|nr:unnamed protein product [Lathyrus sativus]
MFRQLGNFTKTRTVQVQNSMLSIIRSSFKTARGGSRRSDLSKGGGGQINNINGIKEEKKGLTNNSKNSVSE